MIPKVVHMTYKDLSKLPFEIRAKNIALEEMNSDFEFRYYDDLAMFKWIVDNCTLEVRDAFLKIDGKYGAAKADFFSILIDKSRRRHLPGYQIHMQRSIQEPNTWR